MVIFNSYVSLPEVDLQIDWYSHDIEIISMILHWWKCVLSVPMCWKNVCLLFFLICKSLPTCCMLHESVDSVLDVTWKCSQRSTKSLLDVTWKCSERSTKSALDVTWKCSERSTKSALDVTWKCSKRVEIIRRQKTWGVASETCKTEVWQSLKHLPKEEATKRYQPPPPPHPPIQMNMRNMTCDKTTTKKRTCKVWPVTRQRCKNQQTAWGR